MYTNVMICIFEMFQEEVVRLDLIIKFEFFCFRTVPLLTYVNIELS